MMQDLLVSLLPGAAVAALLTLLLRPVAMRAGAVARPTGDRWHVRPVPLLGGMALWGATILVFVARNGLDPIAWPVLVAGTGMFGVGLVDDFVPLKPSTKLNAQIVIACLVVLMGAHLRWTPSPAANALITIFWVVGITNAFNLLDNMDGLCAGIGAIAALALCASIGATQPAAFAYSAALAGAALGFLIFNYRPASIFMGDSGSLFVGASLAVLPLAARPGAQTGVLSALAVPALLMLIPIFDTTFVTLSRKLSARSASSGGRDHTSHRLVALGFSERQAVLLLYGLAAVSGAAAVGMGHAEIREANILMAILLIALVLLGVRLARVTSYGGEDFSVLRNAWYAPLLADVTYRRRVFEVLLDLCLVSVSYYSAYVVRFDREFPEHYPLFVRSLPIVIACQLGSFFVAGVYRGVWRYISLADVTTYAKGVGLGSLGSVMALVYLYRFEGYSRGVFIINAMGLTLLVVGSRLSFRVLGEWASRHHPGDHRALIYGAGDGGALLVRELRNNPRYSYNPIAFLDDDPAKLHQRILRVPVVGGIDRLEQVIAERRPAVVIVSARNIQAERLARLRQVCVESGTRLLQSDFRIEPIGPERVARV